MSLSADGRLAVSLPVTARRARVRVSYVRQVSDLYAVDGLR